MYLYFCRFYNIGSPNFFSKTENVGWVIKSKKGKFTVKHVFHKDNSILLA